MESSATNKQIRLWVICTWGLTWFMALPALAVLKLLGSGILFLLVYALASWSPTFTLLLLFKKLYPGTTIKDFYKNAFKEQLNLKLISFITVIQVMIFIASIGIVSSTKEGPLLDLSAASISMCFFTAITQGALGEESGWRGFLLPTLQKKLTLTKSALIVGIIWWFWHMPIMVFDSGHEGLAWVHYAAIFLVFCIALSIVIAVCYKQCRNLFVPIWIHFVFNVTIPTFVDFNNGEGELMLLTIITVFYLLAAVGYTIWHKTHSKKTA